jgi:hypothetical protein
MSEIPTINLKIPNYLEVEKPVEVKTNLGLVTMYKLFKEKTGFVPQRIYHPCSAEDISPSAAFPESEVVYVDLDEQAMEALKQSGYEAHTASALDFDPGDVDLLIMINPKILPKKPAQTVISAGYVLCNDYHSTATWLNEHDSYQLVALIHEDQGKLKYDSENPADYWVEVDTDDEFQNSPFSWTVANYEAARQLVQIIFGEEENILANYKKIIDLTREQNREKNKKIIAENPDMADYLPDPDTASELFLDYEGQQLLVTTRLPSKKGKSDSIFVFQKKEA